jgi:hypothetical protein
MRAVDSETTDQLCCRADDAITVSCELIAQAKADLERAFAFLQGERYFDGSPRGRKL